PPLLGRDAVAHQRHLDVLARGQRRQQVEFLKHDADLVAPQPCPGAARCHRLAVPQDAAAVRAVDAAQQVDDAALAGTARTQDRDAFARFDREVDRFERHDRAVVERAAHALERNQRWRRLIARRRTADQPLDGADHLRSDSITASMLPWLARSTPRKSSCALIITLWPS